MFKENNDIFNILFEAVSEGVIVVDKKQKIVASNTSAAEMFGYTKSELTDQFLNTLIPLKYRSNHGIHFTGFMVNSYKRKMGHGLDLYGLTKNKKEFPIEVGLNPFKINDNSFVMALVTDITIRKKSELEKASLNDQLEKRIKARTSELNTTIKQLSELNLDFQSEIKKRIDAEKRLKESLKKEIELNELKTKFLSLVSHEFKTPLSGILTSTILLGKYKLTKQQDSRDRHLKTITNKVHYLTSILNDFLSIERLESGKVNYKYTSFNLSKVINEVIYNANMLLKSGQRINIPKNTDEFNLEQDEKILELSLSNLIHNAIKYSPENTTIDLKIAQSGEKLIFKIIDQGIGIPEKDQKYIFNRYFRAENALNDQGTGIGLNIVKGHLENIGGSIRFTSLEGKGTTFIVKIPIVKQL